MSINILAAPKNTVYTVTVRSVIMTLGVNGNSILMDKNLHIL